MGFDTMAMSPDGGQIILGDRSGFLYGWTPRQGSDLFAYGQVHVGAVNHVSYSPNGKRILSIGEDGDLMVSSVVVDRLSGDALLLEREGVLSATFMPDSESILVGHLDGTIHIYDADTGIRGREVFHGFAGSVRAMDYSRDGNRVAIVRSGDGLSFWDPVSDSLVSNSDSFVVSPFFSVAFSPSGTNVVAITNGAINLWTAPAPGNILQIACRYLPHINGRPDISTDGLAAEIGIEGLTLPDNCDTYDPPLPPEFQQ